MAGFSRIAPVYDRFNDNRVYQAWLDFTLSQVDGPLGKLLDLGTGTGILAQKLATQADQVMAIDLDPGMLAVARENFSDQANLTFQELDLLAMEDLDQDFQVVTSYLDTLCFLADQEEVYQAFHQIYSRLQADGVFCFDVWTPEQVVQGFLDFEYFDSDPTSALLWDSLVDDQDLVVNHYLTVFDQREGGVYERVDVQLRERTYPLNTYLTGLVQAGFRQVDIYVNFGQETYHEWLLRAEPEDYVDRWFFVARK